jgi:glycosyltransferase involved in cell wall biosynthesis
MRVLICNNGPWGTGSATVVDGVAEELIAQGHQVKIIFPDSGFETPDARRYYGRPDLYHILRFPMRVNGYRFYTFPLIITDPHPRNYHGAWTYSQLSDDQIEAYFEMWKRVIGEVAAEFQPDIVECQHIWATDQATMRLGLPFVSVAHHSDQMGFRYDERMRRYVEVSAPAARAILAVSERVRQEVIELYPVDPQKVHVVPNGYNHRVFYPRAVSRDAVLDRHLLPLTDLPIVTFAGRLSLTKGVDILLEANRLLQRRCPVLMVLCGAGDPADLPVAEGGLENTVFLGHQPPELLADWHNLATVSVMPSRSEGFGISALEAMGCGTPVVGTPTGSLDQLATRLVPVGGAGELAEAIEELVKMAEDERLALRTQVAAEAAKFSWKAVVDQRLAYYQEPKLLFQRPAA